MDKNGAEPSVEQKTVKEVHAELARSKAELQQFAMSVSHDLQEPLRVVAGYLKLLEQRFKERQSAQEQGFIQEALGGVARMTALIHALLDYSRVTARGQDLAALIDSGVPWKEALASLRAAIEESEARITHDMMPDVLADSLQLSQVFQNLIGNAIKFRRNGTRPDIHVGVQDLGKECEFSIMDNGIGIDPHDRPRLFVVFQRLHGEEIPGTGIGLALCKRIVERHGGRIWIAPQTSAGTTVCFTLPRPLRVHPAEQPHARFVRIVLADDVAALRRLVSLALEDYGSGRFLVVGEAATGMEAIEAARQTQPDLVLLDLSMPQMDGLEALSRLREVAPNSKVVVYSGFVSERLAHTTAELGAVRYIEKGVAPQELVHRLAELAGLDLSASNQSANMMH